MLLAIFSLCVCMCVYHGIVNICTVYEFLFLIYINVSSVSHQKRLPRLKTLLTQQMHAEAREKLRKDLGKMQSKVNYLKNAHFVHPSSTCCSSAGDTLVQRVKRLPKERGIKRVISPER